MSDKFPDVLYVAKNTGTEWLRLMSEKRNDTDVKYVRSSEAHWRAEERKRVRGHTADEEKAYGEFIEGHFPKFTLTRWELGQAGWQEGLEEMKTEIVKALRWWAKSIDLKTRYVINDMADRIDKEL